MKDPIWYAPLNVILHFKKNESSASFKNHRHFKKAEEAFFVATMLVGIMAIQRKKYWVQIVDDDERSPDIRTGNYKNPRGTRCNSWTTQEVEVVTFEDHSNESLLEFLKRTKLSQKKAYDPFTTILCRINKDVRIPPLETLVSELRKENCQSPIIILGKTSTDQEMYKIAQIYPQLDLVIEFDLAKELEANKHTGVLNLKRGLDPIFDSHPEDKHYPFEKIGIIP